jgi:hypothetical protein
LGRPEAQRQWERSQARRRSMKAPGSTSGAVSKARTSRLRRWSLGSQAILLSDYMQVSDQASHCASLRFAKMTPELTAWPNGRADYDLRPRLRGVWEIAVSRDTRSLGRAAFGARPGHSNLGLGFPASMLALPWLTSVTLAFSSLMKSFVFDNLCLCLFFALVMNSSSFFDVSLRNRLPVLVFMRCPKRPPPGRGLCGGG